MSTRFVVVPAVHLLFIEGEDVLLSRRQNTGYEDGRWSVPAGHVDGDEAVRAAGAREAWEEVGIRLVGGDLEFGHVMHRKKNDEERVDFFLVARQWTGEPTIAEPEKCSELKWTRASDLPRDVIPYVAAGLQAAVAGNPYSEFGW